jgi:hypothetical protein
MIHSLKLLIRLVGTATRCLDPPTSTTAKASSWRSAIGDTDDFALQPIVSLKFIEICLSGSRLYNEIHSAEFHHPPQKSTSTSRSEKSRRTTLMARCRSTEFGQGHSKVSTCPKVPADFRRDLCRLACLNTSSEEVLNCFAMSFGWRSLPLNQWLRPPYLD